MFMSGGDGVSSVRMDTMCHTLHSVSPDSHPAGAERQHAFLTTILVWLRAIDDAAALKVRSRTL